MRLALRVCWILCASHCASRLDNTECHFTSNIYSLQTVSLPRSFAKTSTCDSTHLLHQKQIEYQFRRQPKIPCPFLDSRVCQPVSIVLITSACNHLIICRNVLIFLPLTEFIQLVGHVLNNLHAFNVAPTFSNFSSVSVR